MNQHPQYRDTLIIGGGPAGMALLLAASRDDSLRALLRRGLAVVERSSSFGAGALGGYGITSDSTADTFLTSVRGHPIASLARLAAHPSALAIAAHGGGQGVPLACVGDFLATLGTALAGVARLGGGGMLAGHEALGATRTDAGWTTRIRRLADGATQEIASRNLVIATGGEQSPTLLAAAEIAGETLATHCGDRLAGAHDVLATGGLARITARLAGIANPRIAIIGGSTSAITTANLILNAPLGARLGGGGLTVLHRRPLRPFYPSAAAARDDGFVDFTADDICPLSGFVYRLAGFRTEARALVLAALAIGGRTPDPRLHLHLMRDGDARAQRRILAEADLVIAALGYRPRALPLADSTGRPIPLAAADGRSPMVDSRCRVLDSGKRPLPGLFGIGLAAGFVPSGALGGEPSFSGQANGLWLWQNAVGARIVEGLSQRALPPPLPTTEAPIEALVEVGAPRVLAPMRRKRPASPRCPATIAAQPGTFQPAAFLPASPA